MLLFSKNSCLNNFCIISCAIIIVIVVSLFYSLDAYPIVTRGEGREAQVVQAILEDSTKILPLRNGSVIPSKPPFFHYIAVCLSKSFGYLSELSLRLPSLISYAVSIIVLFYFSISSDRKILGFVACIIFASSLDPLRHAVMARVDSVFACLLFLSAAFIYRALLLKQAHFGMYALICITLVLGALTKGPAGIILPVLIAYASGVVIKGKHFDLKPRLLLTVILAVVCISLWYYFVSLELGFEFIQTQIVRENMSRIFPGLGGLIGHKKPFGIGLLKVLISCIPWFIFLPRLVQTARNLKREDVKKDSFFIFSCIFVCVFLALMLFVGSKRSVYFLPAMPACAYVIAFLLEYSRKIQIKRSIQLFETIILFIVLLLMLLGLLGVLLVKVFAFVDMSTLAEMFTSVEGAQLLGVFRDYAFTVGLTLGALSCIVSLRELRSGRIEKAVLGIACLFSILFLTSQIVIAPKVHENYDPRVFGSRVRNIVSGHNLYQYHEEFFAAVYAINKRAPVVNAMHETYSENRLFFLVSERHLDRFFKMISESQITVMRTLPILESKTLLANRKGKLRLYEVVLDTTRQSNPLS